MSVLSKYRKYRMKACLTQVQAADFLGISTTYLCLIEQLKLNPTRELLAKMISLYQCSSKELS